MWCQDHLCCFKLVRDIPLFTPEQWQDREGDRGEKKKKASPGGFSHALGSGFQETEWEFHLGEFETSCWAHLLKSMFETSRIPAQNFLSLRIHNGPLCFLFCLFLLLILAGFSHPLGDCRTDPQNQWFPPFPVLEAVLQYWGFLKAFTVNTKRKIKQSSILCHHGNQTLLYMHLVFPNEGWNLEKYSEGLEWWG